MKGMVAAALLSLVLFATHGSAQELGQWALPGIDTIPPDAIVLSDAQVRKFLW